MTENQTSAQAPEPEPVQTWADGFGLVHARVRFTAALSESDPHTPFNLEAQMPRIRSAARQAVIDFLTERGARTGESPDQTRERLRACVRIRPHRIHADALNLIHGIEFIECSGEDPLEGLDAEALTDLDEAATENVAAELERVAHHLRSEQLDPTALAEAVCRSIDDELAGRGAFLRFDQLDEDTAQRVLDAAGTN